MGNSTILTIDGTNPQLWGRYSCRQWNPVSLKFSNPVNVQKPVTNQEIADHCIAIIGLGLSLLVTFNFLLHLILEKKSCTWICSLPRRKKDLIINIYIKTALNAIPTMDKVVRILNGILAVIVSWFVHHFNWIWLFLSLLVLSAMKIFYVVQCPGRWTWINNVAGRINCITDILIMPGFFLFKIYLFYTQSDYACGEKMSIYLPLYMAIGTSCVGFPVLIISFYIKSQLRTGGISFDDSSSDCAKGENGDFVDCVEKGKMSQNNTMEGPGQMGELTLEEPLLDKGTTGSQDGSRRPDPDNASIDCLVGGSSHGEG